MKQSDEFVASVCKSAYDQLKYRNDRDIIIADLQAESKDMNRKLDEILEAHRIQMAEKDAWAETMEKNWQADFDEAVEEKVKPLRKTLYEHAGSLADDKKALEKERAAFNKERGIFDRDRTEIQAFRKAAGGGEDALIAHYKSMVNDVVADQKCLELQVALSREIITSTEKEMCLARQEILLQGDLIAAHQKEISRLTKAMAKEKKASDKKIESAKTEGEARAQELQQQKTLYEQLQRASENNSAAMSALATQVTALNRLTAEQGKQLEARVVELKAELKAENGQIKSDANQQKSELGIVQSRMDASDAEHALTREVLLGVRFSSSSPDMCIQINLFNM